MRKSITLRVDKEGQVLVKAPYLVSNKTINNFVEKHKDWIEKKQNENKINNKKFEEWESFYYLWYEYLIIFDDWIKKLFFNWDNFLSPIKSQTELKKDFINFYKKEAKKYISERLEYISKMNNLKFNNYRITSAKSRWWSCSTKKNLNFTFRLIMAPKSTIDYVIIHELSHLKEMNHSKKFRKEVESMSKNVWLINYKNDKKWLKENGNKISYV